MTLYKYTKLHPITKPKTKEVDVALSDLHYSKTMIMAEENNLESDRDGYTEDGTVDLKRRQILRSKTGRWKACSFILGKHVTLY